MKTLIKSTGISTISTIGWLTVAGIVLPGANEPVGTKLRVLFRVAGGTWKKFSGGAWTDVATQILTIDSVLAQGNTAPELTAISSSTLLEWLKNANVEWAVAMEDSGLSSPEIAGIKLNGSTGENRTSTTYLSVPIEMSTTGNEAVRVLGVDVVSQTVGTGNVAVDVAVKASREEWSDWQALSAIKAAINNLENPLMAIEMKFRVTLSVNAIGTGTAQITSISVKRQADNVSTGIAGEGYIITKTLNAGLTMSNAHLKVWRPPTRDSSLESFCSMRPAPILVENEVLGVGNGSAQNKTIAYTTKFAQHTFKLFFNGVQQTTGYSVTVGGAVSYVAPNGVTVTCSYEYNHEAETWTKMIHDAEYRDEDGNLRSQFDYQALEGGQKGALVAFKIAIKQGSGTVVNENKGKATGLFQNVILAHDAKPETISVSTKTGSTITPLPTDKWRWEAASGLLYVTAPKDADILVSYDWLAPAPTVGAIVAIVNR